MATYVELFDLRNNAELRNKVSVAVIIKAESMMSGTPTAPEKAWIVKAFANPETEGRRVLMGVLAANKANTVSQITGATDAAIQTNVDAVVPTLVDADAGA